MKKSKQQLLIINIALCSVLVFGATNCLFAQNEATKATSNFSIIIESNNDAIKLTCKKGCSWKELSLNLAVHESQEIDQSGMVSGEKAISAARRKYNEALAKEDSSRATFSFTIKRIETGLSLEGLAGTAWQNLSFSCTESKCNKEIDQKGMKRPN